MRIGLQAVGIGPGADPAILRSIARAADDAGFATLWVGEHVVLLDGPASRYPYAEEGDFPIDAGVDWLDPFAALTFAAAVTDRIRLATGICLVPEHNPLVLAKRVASLDRKRPHDQSGRRAFGRVRRAGGASVGDAPGTKTPGPPFVVRPRGLLAATDRPG
jgi:hypothetical protein